MDDAKIKSLVVTFIPSLTNYEDRIQQLNNSAKLEKVNRIIVFTKTFKEQQDVDFLKKYQHLQFEFLSNSITNKSIFLQFKILNFILRETSKITLIDWFGNFYLIGVFFKFRRNSDYVFSPVISNWGWVFKQLRFEVPIFSSRYTWNRLKAIPSEFISLWVAKYVVVQSEDLKKFYSSLYLLQPNKIIVNYNYSSLTPKEEINQNTTNVVIGFIGNFEKHKGNKIIYNLANSSNYSFYIAGGAKGYLNKKLLNKIRTLKNVRYLGKLDRLGVINFYEDIDILLLPSYHEGSPRVITEFINYNKPIITFNNPGLDYCKENKNVYQLHYYEDYKGFLKIIRTLQQKESICTIYKAHEKNSTYALFN